ncbi:MAG: leucine-rich repeat protein [Clostridia bacterium]|nr:leucine-rich repeat protein [Clostridia bacterium]
MKKFRRLTSLVLCVLMLVSMLTFCQVSFAFAETDGDYVFTINEDNQAVITDYIGTEVVVNVPSKLDGYRVVAIGDYAFEGKDITDITLSADITTIGVAAFKDCSYLSYVSLPLGLKIISDGAFIDCASLTGLTIGTNVTYIGLSALSGCSALTNLTVPFVGKTPSNNGSLAEIFDGVSDLGYPAALTKVTVTSDNTVDVGAFKGMSKVTDIIWKTNPTVIGVNAFADCTSLSHLDMGMTKLTVIPTGAFANCKALTSITLPSSVTEVAAGAFKGASALATISVSDSLKKVGKNAFAGTRWLADQAEGNVMIGKVYYTCKGNAAEINVPDTTIGIADSAWENNKSITSVTIPNSVTYIGVNVLKGASNLNSLSIPFIGATVNAEEDLYIGYLFGATNRADNKKVMPAKLTEIALNNDKNIEAGAFSDCFKLKKITIGSTVTSIEADAFSGCTALKEVVYNAQNATIEDGAFADSSIKTITFGTSVKTIPTYLCTSNSALTSVTIPAAVTKISSRAFSGCYNISVLNFNATNCSSIAADAFDYCHKLTNINIGNGVERIPVNLYSPYGGGAQTTISIPASVTTIDANAFANCTALTTLYYNATNCTIGANAFSACTKLDNIQLASNVTVIPANLYTGNVAITEINIPSKIVEIKEQAFAGCKNLLEVTVPDTLTVIGKDILIGTMWYEMQADGPLYLGHIYYGYKGAMDGNTIDIENGTVAIAAAAFAGNSALESVFIPNSVTVIGDGAFDLTNATITCYANATHILDYAEDNGISVNVIDCPESVVYYEIIQKATASVKGTWEKFCLDCGQTLGQERYTAGDEEAVWVLTTAPTCTVFGKISLGADEQPVPALGHGTPVWKITVKATCAVNGEVKEYCGECDAFLGDIRVLDKLEHVAGTWENIKRARTYCTGMDAIQCTECDEILQSRVLPKIDETEITLDNYTDILSNAWYSTKGTILFAVANGLFEGVDISTFAPNEAMTRAMFVTVLGRLHGVDVSSKAKTEFTDVEKGTYYIGYVAWAAKNNIVNGVTNTTFCPDQNVTREQICTMIVRYCNYAGIELKATVEEVLFRDADKISPFAWNSVGICQKAGLVQGVGDNYFAPTADASRAEVAQILKNLALGFLAE